MYQSVLGASAASGSMTALAYTGTNSLVLAALGGALVLGGLVLLRASQMRRRSQEAVSTTA
jgi:uncharacterized membrane protein YgdD (TMEM256/DUF423 family)